MKKIIYNQIRQSEMIKIKLLFLFISLMGLGSLAISIFSENRTTLLFVIPFLAILFFLYLSLREFIKYGADIEINSENFVIDNKVFEFVSLSEVGQCTNRQLIYFIFNKENTLFRFVGFNRFTNKELMILNDKTVFVEMIKKLTNSPVSNNG